MKNLLKKGGKISPEEEDITIFDFSLE